MYPYWVPFFRCDKSNMGLKQIRIQIMTACWELVKITQISNELCRVGERVKSGLHGPDTLTDEVRAGAQHK